MEFRALDSNPSFPAVYPWPSHFTSLSSYFLIFWIVFRFSASLFVKREKGTSL